MVWRFPGSVELVSSARVGGALLCMKDGALLFDKLHEMMLSTESGRPNVGEFLGCKAIFIL